jgi:two-component system cell cycle sensor histidine kinase/response regulator CckA
VEEALRESEERYRLIAENVTDVIWLADMNFRFTYVSPSIERLRGYSAGEVMAQSLADVLTPASLVRAMEILEGERENIERGESRPRTVEFEFKCKDGSTVQTESTVSVLYDENKVPIGILGSTRDTTERKRAEEALRRERDKAQKYLDLAGVMMVALNEEGEITLINRKGCQILGYEKEEELIGRDWFDTCVPPQIREEVRSVFEQLMKAEVEPVEFYENPVLTISGEVRIVAWHNALLTDGTGAVTGTLSSGEDVTERRQAEQERERLLAQIRAQARRMQQILDTVPEGVLLLDADERIILVNPVAEGELVFLSDAKVGDTLTRLGDRPLAEILTSPPKGLWHEVATDGRSFQVIARPIENGSTPAGWVLVIRDVTQQREIQQRIGQQERLAAVGQLAAGIAHDFNNIMATVVLYAQMTARMEGLPAVVRERMETIDGQAEHATNLIQQILDFSRRAVLERRPLDLVPLLKEHVRLLERTLPENVEITLDCKPDERTTLFTVNADPTRMQQMVTNLALNARDAMPQGGELRIGLERIEVKRGESPILPEMAPGEWIAVTVSDTGTGIPPDVLPHIFEPFFTTRAPLGSGLGLAQVHGIVGQHGGRVDVETRVGRGTVFIIYLPAHRLEPSPIPSRTELPALPAGAGETILVVEDNAVVRKALVDSLRLLNYRVLEVSNGQEALEMLEQREGEVALVLSDVVMPRMSGIALLHALRERGLTVHVVMLSGHPVEREMEGLQAKGMVDWLPKPPRLEQLAEAVARALGTDSVPE